MSGKGGDTNSRPSKLSTVDKQILKVLLEPNSGVSSHMLEEKLGIPRSTIQRRRKHLEKEYLEHSYTLNLGSLGFRRVDLLIYTGGGATQAIAKELLKLDEVVYVGRSIGEHNRRAHHRLESGGNRQGQLRTAGAPRVGEGHGQREGRDMERDRRRDRAEAVGPRRNHRQALTAPISAILT
jgi:DNA-binding Lrp family transcriptional regulator